MDDILKPFLSSRTPSPPKFNVNWGALAPMEEIIRPPKFGGGGFNKDYVAGFEYVVHLQYSQGFHSNQPHAKKCKTMINTTCLVKKRDKNNNSFCFYLFLHRFPFFALKNTTSTSQQPSTQEDAWVVVNGEAIDVTKWISIHPGGEQAIMAYLGKDPGDPGDPGTGGSDPGTQPGGSECTGLIFMGRDTGKLGFASQIWG